MQCVCVWGGGDTVRMEEGYRGGVVTFYCKPQVERRGIGIGQSYTRGSDVGAPAGAFSVFLYCVPLVLIAS